MRRALTILHSLKNLARGCVRRGGGVGRFFFRSSGRSIVSWDVLFARGPSSGSGVFDVLGNLGAGFGVHFDIDVVQVHDGVLLQLFLAAVATEADTEETCVML